MKSFIVLILLLLTLSSNAQTDGVGINTTDPKSTLDINGTLSVKVTDLNGGPAGTETPIVDGVYFNLTPTAGNLRFRLPDADEFPGRIYILRNISDTENAEIRSDGGNFFAGNSRVATAEPVVMTPDIAGDGNDVTKTLIFVSDGTNWTYGTLGF